MQISESEKPITVSVQLVPGRDDDILALKKPSVNLSEIMRQGAKLLIRQRSGHQNFETEVLDSLERIETLLIQGSSVMPQNKPKFGNSILDSSP